MASFELRRACSQSVSKTNHLVLMSDETYLEVPSDNQEVNRLPFQLGSLGLDDIVDLIETAVALWRKELATAEEVDIE